MDQPHLVALRSLRAVVTLLPLLATIPACRAQDYQFPFKGEDMQPGERIFTGDHASGIQGEGEDLGAMRYLGNGAWSHVASGTNGQNNADFVIYGKPVYAIADGIVVGGWRNAPENPVPGQHHPDFTAGFIPGGGNMLWVDQPDGKRVLYAHMTPGSIPPALCPNNDALFPYSMTIQEGDAYLMYDVADQVPIKKGDFLGRVGNSGSSSAPHLHLHAEAGGSAAVMRFELGLFKPLEKYTDILGGWASFAGQEVPDGEVLIRPSRAVPYRMKDFESYSLEGGQMYAGIFEPGTHGPMALFESSWSTFVSEWGAIEKQGYRMKDFEAYEDDGKLVYAGIFEPGKFNPVALFRTDWNDFHSGWAAIETKGYRMKDFEVYPYGSGLMYAGIFEPGSHSPMALIKSDWGDFLAGWQAIEKKGYRMKDFESYLAGSTRMYAGIFEPGKHAPVALFQHEWSDFLAGWQAIEKKGYRMKDLEVYGSGKNLMYSGIFEPGKFAPAALFIKDDWAAFLEAWQILE